MGWLSELLRGGGGELGWDDLVRRIVDAVAPLRRHGPRGEVAFPPDVLVRIAVPEGTRAIAQGFLARPELDREVRAALANRCDVAAESLPMCEYALVTADRFAVTASEAVPRPWQLAIRGGDRDGAVVTLPATWTQLSLGRGAQNDVVVCEHTEFVSRRAGMLMRTGYQLEIEALDQGDQLVVRRANGDAIRPARTARGRVALAPGDTVELGDGRGGGDVKLVVQR